MQHVKVMFAHRVAKAVCRAGGFLQQLFFQPILGNLLERGPGNHHYSLAVLRARCNEIEDRTRRGERGRSLKPERVLRGVGRSNPLFKFTRAALPNLHRLWAEHVKGRADGVDAVDVVAGRFRVEVLLDVVIVLEHVQLGRLHRCLDGHAVGFVFGVPVRIQLYHFARVVRERVGLGVVAISTIRVVNHDRACNDRHVRRRHVTAARRYAFRHLYGFQVPAFQEVIIKEVHAVSDEQQCAGSSRLGKADAGAVVCKRTQRRRRAVALDAVKRVAENGEHILGAMLGIKPDRGNVGAAKLHVFLHHLEQLQTRHGLHILVLAVPAVVHIHGQSGTLDGWKLRLVACAY